MLLLTVKLQAAVLQHKAGLIRVMDDKCNSTDLANALKGNTKIIATTIQKFPYIVDSVANLKKHFAAVIIDEAHSSTVGKDMYCYQVSRLITTFEDVVEDVEDVITKENHKEWQTAECFDVCLHFYAKVDHASAFLDMSIPKASWRFPFYSMKQAIEEGFILDVPPITQLMILL